MKRAAKGDSTSADARAASGRTLASLIERHPATFALGFAACLHAALLRSVVLAGHSQNAARAGIGARAEQALTFEAIELELIEGDPLASPLFAANKTSPHALGETSALATRSPAVDATAPPNPTPSPDDSNAYEAHALAWLGLDWQVVIESAPASDKTKTFELLPFGRLEGTYVAATYQDPLGPDCPMATCARRNGEAEDFDGAEGGRRLSSDIGS